MVSVPVWPPRADVACLLLDAQRVASVSASDLFHGPSMKSTVKPAQDIERLFKQGKPFRTRFFTIRCIQTPEERDQSGRVAFIAGKRLGNAVMRNRSRRVLRELFYRSDGPWEGYDVAFIANHRTARASMDELDAAYAKVISRCAGRDQHG